MPKNADYAKIHYAPSYSIGLFGLVGLNILLGVGSTIILSVLTKGFELFF